ncbi:MAG: SUMF1/EgtB/PvdO family nonheme iron enzyme [Treponema sp.]|jgi:formylglycine-generating enzyme required for sulfatase activity|nr:SUMF1/EgtB/PvdO family nonheme iron enzyme [Treponema sp.]
MKANNAGCLRLGLLLLLPFCLGARLEAQQKYALVIGNAAYTTQAPLRNTPNDAVDMKTALEGLGFQVDVILNGTLRQMKDGVRNLAWNLGQQSGSYGFFYYSGHGLQYRGENYLIPVNADLKSEADLPYEALHAQQVLDQLEEAGNELNIVVLDACRNTPYGWSKSSNKGLAVVGRQPAGSIIIYATSAGQTASDGNRRNGTFTAELLKNLKTPGLEVKEVFTRTGAEVSRVSGKRQIPVIYLQFFGSAYLVEEIKQAVGNLDIAAASAGTLHIRGEGIDRDVSYSEAGTLPVSGLQTGTYRLMMRYGDGKSEEQTVEVEDGKTAKVSFSYRVAIPSGFVKILGGTFMMGSPAGEAGRDGGETQRRVTVSGFYMSAYEVTQKEWAAVMGSDPSSFKGDNLPVENVSWYDAIEYRNKRSVKEGLTPAYTRNGGGVAWIWSANGYRLPTEAEWEYACRAGTTAPFYTGNNITTNQANYNGNYPYNGNPKGEYRKKTLNVGGGMPNAWGLYDMHGNVYEWCWDWYGAYEGGAQTDPSGAAAGSHRVARGGSWSSHAQYLRSAHRNCYTPSD